MAKRKYGKHRGSKPRDMAKTAAPIAAPAKPVHDGPVRSEKMQALMAAAADRAAAEPARRTSEFVPKPRAIRRFEKYAGMGGD